MAATPGDLRKCIASTFGVSVNSVTPVDRALVTAGLRRVGGRGSSAVKVNANDAAALLIAVATPGTISKAPDRVVSYGALPCVVTDLNRRNHPVPFPHFTNLPTQHTFGEALSALLADYAEGNLPPVNEGWLAEIKLTSPWRSAVIRFSGELDKWEAVFVYMLTDTQDENEDDDQGAFGDGAAADLSAEYRFTLETLKKVGQLISMPKEDK